MKDFKYYNFPTKKMADEFQKLCSQSSILTKRDGNFNVAVYIKNAKQSVYTLSRKYYNEVVMKYGK